MRRTRKAKGARRSQKKGSTIIPIGIIMIILEFERYPIESVETEAPPHPRVRHCVGQPNKWPARKGQKRPPRRFRRGGPQPKLSGPDQKRPPHRVHRCGPQPKWQKRPLHRMRRCSPQANGPASSLGNTEICKRVKKREQRSQKKTQKTYIC